MHRILISLVALGAVTAVAHTSPILAPATTSSTSEVRDSNSEAGSLPHCQVPCGIYGDKMRIDMLMEDAATIEKAMTSLQAMDQEASPSKNQMVRWVVNKESHAQNIQDTVAAYWLAQRIKTPKDANDVAAFAKYHRQLSLLHRITVAAMKCKQTTDKAHVANLRKLALEFSESYFKAEDLEHIKSHHSGHGH